ncbi:hypothetical protein [Streptomyces sp. NPDC020983]|uniref:hypothetical protein n=1 Tax=Streptomyces sp. NPDC020983 TaxID=3365106 RepID=UPI00379A62F7
MIATRTAPRSVRLVRAACAAVALAALATACGGHDEGDTAPQTSSSPVLGRLHVVAPDVDLTVTDAVAHVDASGTGTLTMTIHNGSGVPEHLDMVATPDSGRGQLVGGRGSGSGSMTSAGILLAPGATVTFGSSSGPSVRLTRAHLGADHTLPLKLEFGVARLVELSARVSGG